MSDSAARNGLLRASVLVSAWTLVSRVLGFVRDVLLAGWFGAGAGMDAFLVAFKIPNFLRRLFAEGAFSQAFVPVLAQTRQRDGVAGVRELVARTSGLLATVLALLTLLAMVMSPALISVFAPGFGPEDGRAALAADLLRITFPYLLFISLVALVSAVLHTWQRFAWPAFAPILLNLCLIGFGGWGVHRGEDALAYLAWGVFAAGAAQLILVLVPLYRLGLLVWPQWAPGDPRVRRILTLMAPIIFASSVAQVALLIDSILASLLDVGSVSWLYFADRLMELPLGVFAIAIGTVLLPGLSRAHAQGGVEDFARQLHWAVLVTAAVVLPAAVALFVLAEPLVAALFQYGAFTPEDTRHTAIALRAYALGLLGFSVVKILFPAYSSRQDTRTPVKIAVLALSVGMIFNLIVVGWAIHAERTGAHWLLALGTSLAACINAGLLWYRLPPALRHNAPTRLVMRFAGAAAGMGLLLWSLLPAGEVWINATPAWRIGMLIPAIMGGLASYGVLLAISGVRPRHILRPEPSA